MLDPTNSILKLKVPIFVLFLFSLFVNYKPQIKYIDFFVLMFAVFVVSMCFGVFSGGAMDYQFTMQYATFFLLLICVLWDSYIDLFTPLVVSSVFVSIITIIGFISMISFPALESGLYLFSTSFDYTFLMSKRTFMGVEFTSFFYKSIPLVVIPASFYLNEIINNNKASLKNILLVFLFLFSLFCAGNRAMIGVVFLIAFFISYDRISKWPFIKPLLFIVFVAAVYIGYLSITEKGEESNDIKFGHIESYIDYFKNSWYMLLFGSGAGSTFFSKGFESMTGITEWTYLELIRLYGIVGFVIFVMFLLYPLRDYNAKLRNIYGWKAFSLGYVFYLFICASNPYLTSSTGFLCILLIYSICSNPRYRINKDFV